MGGGATFTMSGGSIEGCVTNGVDVSNGKFDMSDGTVKDCATGVAVGADSTFTMTGGEVTDNGVGVTYAGTTAANVTLGGGNNPIRIAGNQAANLRLGSDTAVTTGVKVTVNALAPNSEIGVTVPLPDSDSYQFAGEPRQDRGRDRPSHHPSRWQREREEGRYARHGQGQH